QLVHRVVGAGVVHRHQLVLLKMGVQLLFQKPEKLDGAGPVVVQVDHRRDKILFFAAIGRHCASTSSKSYTVLILPESTLTKSGPAAIFRTTVGRESSISLAFKIGFMLKRLPL